MDKLTFFLLLISSVGSVFFLLLVSINNNRLEYFSPPAIFAVLVLFGGFFKVIYLYFVDSSIINEVTGGENVSILLYGAVAIIFSSISFVVGYMSYEYRKGTLIRTVEHNKKKPNYLLITIVTVMALAMCHLYFSKMGVYYAISTGDVSSKRFLLLDDGAKTSLSYLTWGADILFVIFIISLLRNKKVRKVGIIPLVLLVLSIFVLFASSNRMAILLYLFTILIIYRELHKEKFKLPIIKIVLIFSIVVGGMGLLRQSSQTGTDLSANSEVIASSAHLLFSHMFEKPYLLSLDKTSLVIVRTGGNYLYGQSFISVFLAPIPRALWRDKPNVRVGQYVGKEIYQRSNDSGVPPGFLGELYLNFSWVGIFLGSLCLGFFSNIVYTSCVRARKDTFAIGLYAIFIISFITLFAADFVGAVSQMARLLIPYLVLFSFFGGGKEIVES